MFKGGAKDMSKKGIFLSIILIILLLSIALIISKQNNKPKPVIKIEENKNVVIEDDSEIVITAETGINLEKLKSYKLPILIQLRVI